MKNLKKIRDKKGITQIKLSSNIGVSQETISAYEVGKTLPSADTLIKIADYFDTSVDYLLDRTDVSTPVEDLIISNLNSDEASLIVNYRKLSVLDKSKVEGFVFAITNA